MTTPTAFAEPAATASRWLGYLSDETRVTARVDALCEKVERRLDVIDGPVKTFEVSNLFALALFRAGRIEDARAVCHAELAFALRCKGSADWPRVAAYAVQPQINLFRIDGFVDDHARALRGLARLAGISLYRKGALPDADVDTADWAAVRDWPVLRNTLRDVVISDTCKIVYRRADADALLAAASILRADWPLSDGCGAQHAYEAPFLVDAISTERMGLARTDKATVPGRLTRAVQLAHLATQLAHAGEPDLAAKQALASRQLLDDAGNLALQSRLTIPRIRSAVADTLLVIGDVSLAHAEFRRVMADLADDDPALSRGIRQRLGDPEQVRTQGGDFPDPARLRKLLDRILSVLTGSRP
jgi:hypothetical protein